MLSPSPIKSKSKNPKIYTKTLLRTSEFPVRLFIIHQPTIYHVEFLQHVFERGPVGRLTAYRALRRPRDGHGHGAPVSLSAVPSWMVSLRTPTDTNGSRRAAYSYIAVAVAVRLYRWDVLYTDFVLGLPPREYTSGFWG